MVKTEVHLTITAVTTIPPIIPVIGKKSHSLKFRPKAGPGLWLPALLPVSCVALGILSGFSSAAPLMILSLMSCCCCYLMLHSRYSIKSLPLTSFSSESSPNQNSSESFICKKSSTLQYKSYCVALQPIKSNSTDRRLQILCISVAVILLYQAPNAGFVMAATSVLVNVVVVVVV
ncbi:uncharacterized protein LOC108677545, partial [Hyalella azteca]|uniref:Uncharacterized protein LOC108677545 n=1 Tax=Hyalella azteca TaxID=294128 RepID=A0A8B7P5Q6_HYAAZ